MLASFPPSSSIFLHLPPCSSSCDEEPSGRPPDPVLFRFPSAAQFSAGSFRIFICVFCRVSVCVVIFRAALISRLEPLSVLMRAAGLSCGVLRCSQRAASSQTDGHAQVSEQVKYEGNASCELILSLLLLFLMLF